MFTPIYGWRVERRDSDFKWLVDRLRKEFPLIKIPKPGKKSANCMPMEDWLKSVLDNKPLLKSNFLAYWLSYPDKDKFYARKSKEFKNNLLDNIQVKLHQEFDKSLVKKLIHKVTDGGKIHKSTIEHQKVINYEIDPNSKFQTVTSKALMFDDDNIPIDALDDFKSHARNSIPGHPAPSPDAQSEIDTDYH